MYEKQTSGTTEEVLARLGDAVKANHFGVISELDLRAKLAEKGVEFAPECWIVEVCNPLNAKQVLERDITLALMLPCRICVYEREGILSVGTLLPTELLGLMHQPELIPVAADVEKTLIKIIDETCM